MTRRKGTQVKNLAASVRARLLSRARAEGEDFNYLLTRYVLERVLYRLSVSPHRSSFLLKGAMLFTLWSQRPLLRLGKLDHHPSRIVRRALDRRRLLVDAALDVAQSSSTSGAG